MKQISIMTTVFLLLFWYIIQPTYVQASIIKQGVSSNGNVVYYVNSEEDNFIAFSMIKAKMQSDAEIIYNGDIVNNASYLDKCEKYKYMPQPYVMNSSYGDKLSYFSSIVTQFNYIQGTLSAKYHFQYLETPEQTKEVDGILNSNIKLNIKDSQTDYQKVLWAYKWIIDVVHYDNTLSHYSAYDGLKSTGTVCNGYSALFCKLVNKLGVDCACVSGTIKNNNVEYSHAWNIVKLNNKWYCVDPTGGDGQNCFDKYFLKSKNNFSSSDYYYHDSELYNIYIQAGEIFATEDYNAAVSPSETHGMLPSVYNIQMDILKKNVLEISEGYTFLISNIDNTPISFKSENPKVANVDNNGIITGVSKGETEVVAFNKDLNIEQRCKITVTDNNGDSPILSTNNLSLKVKSKSKISVNNTLLGSNIKFTSSTPSVAKVDINTGKVIAIRKGKCKITCTITNGTSIYKLACNVTIK